MINVEYTYLLTFYRIDLLLQMHTFCNIDKYAIVNKSVYIRMSNTGNQHPVCVWHPDYNLYSSQLHLILGLTVKDNAHDICFPRNISVNLSTMEITKYDRNSPNVNHEQNYWWIRLLRMSRSENIIIFSVSAPAPHNACSRMNRIHPFNPHDASKHHFANLNDALIS